MKKILEKLNKNLVADEATRMLFQFKLIVMAFAFVSCFMTILNAVTRNWILGSVTMIFFLICVICGLLLESDSGYYMLSLNLFTFGIVVMMTYFIVTGGVDNFSILWLILLPALGILFFGIRHGTTISGIVLGIMLLCFYVSPFKDITTDYGSTFRTRFPIVYMSSYIVAVIMEYIRFVSSAEIDNTKNRYMHLYTHDALTGLQNRYGLNNYLETLKTEKCQLAVGMLDIDFFKSVNDKFGHDQGDVILTQIAFLAAHVLDEYNEAFRWGGEEFALLFRNTEQAEELCLQLLDEVRKKEFILNEQIVHITVSIGLAYSDKTADEADYRELFIKADDCLYRAKRDGRDRLVTSK